MAGVDALTANILPVEFSFEVFRVWKRPVRDGEDLAGLREALAGVWNVQWEDGQLYLLPLTEGSHELEDAELVERKVGESFRFMARLVTDSLVRRFPTYEALRRKPFTFLGRRFELMHDVGRALDLDHPLLSDFRIWPKYSLDGRIVEVSPDAPLVAIAVELATRWEITSSLDALAEPVNLFEAGSCGN
jgi:hypothetical protein